MVSSIRTKLIFTLTLTILLFGLASLPQASASNVIKSFDSPGNDPQGLAWDGQYLWNADENSNKIYKIDPSDGTVVKSFDPPGYSPRGLAWDGQYLWNADWAIGKIYRIDPSDGTVVKSSHSPGSVSGLAWDGEYLWCSDFHYDKVYKIDPSDGTVVKSFRSPPGRVLSEGLAWDGQYLWDGEQDSDKIYKIDPSDGAVVKSFDSPYVYPTGLAWDGKYLWNADSGFGDSGKIYKIDITVYTLSMSVFSGNGSFSLNPSGGVYDEGTVVTVTADPDSGYYLHCWAGDVPYESRFDNPITIDMDSDKKVYAQFHPKRYDLSTSVGSGSGSVLLSPSGGTYEAGSEVTVTADPDSGYEFDHWSGDLSGSDPSQSLTIDSDKSVTACFSELFSLSTSVGTGEGEVSLTPSGGNYSEGTTVTVTATSDSGYEFDHWSGDISGESNSVDITIDSDKSVTANFTLEQFDLSTSIGSGNGSISLSPSGGTYDYGTTVTVTATPDTGYKFDQWSGDLTGSDSSQSLTMDSDKSVTASFDPKQYSLTTSVGSGNGSISLSPSGGTYDYGTTVTVTANPDSGYVFDQWSGDLSGTDFSKSLTIDSDKSVTANFLEPVTLTFTDQDGDPLSNTEIYYSFSKESEDKTYLETTDSSGEIKITDSDLFGKTMYFESSNEKYTGKSSVGSEGETQTVEVSKETGSSLPYMLLAVLIGGSAAGGGGIWYWKNRSGEKKEEKEEEQKSRDSDTRVYGSDEDSDTPRSTGNS